MTTRRTLPVEPFRDRAQRLLDQGETLSTMAARGGYVGNRGKIETSAFARACGLALQPEHNKTLLDGTPMTYAKRKQETVSFTTAIKLCRALDLDYVDVGI